MAMFDRAKKPIVVKVYEDRNPKRAAKAFERDAQSMSRKGYDVINVIGDSSQKTSMSILAGGIGLLAKVQLTVTYKLRDPQ